MENNSNNTNQNHIDHVDQETNYQIGSLDHDDDSSVFVSTSPSKQKVNAAINEVINDRLLPSEPVKKDMDKEVVNEIMNDVMNSVEENVNSALVETNSVESNGGSNVDLKNNHVESAVEDIHSENTITENHTTTKKQTNNAVNVEKPKIVNNINDNQSNNNSVINEIIATDSSEVLKEPNPVDLKHEVPMNGVVDIKLKDTKKFVDDISKSKSLPSLAFNKEDTPKSTATEINDNFNNTAKTQIDNTTEVPEIIPEQPTFTTTDKSGENEETANSKISEKETVSESTIEKTESKLVEWLDILGNGLLKKKVACCV